jgi:hypothetical protein
MTNLQLLLSIGIPCLLILLSIFQNNIRFTALEKRMEGMDKRADGIDGRFTKLENELRDFRAEHHRDLMGLHADLKEFYGMTTKLEGRVDEISKR